MTDETTTEQLAEIEGQREPVRVREGRWKTRNGDIRNVTLTPSHDSRAKRWPWRDAAYDQTWTPNGQNQFDCEESPSDLAEYLGPIEPDKTQELPTKTQEPEDKTQELPAQYTPPEGWRLVRFGELLLPGDEIVQIDDGRRYPTHRIGDSVGANQQYIRRIGPQPEPEHAAIELLRSEVSYVQVMLGESRQRVTTLEELVTSLRTINEAQEQGFDAANKENTALRQQVQNRQQEYDRQKARIEFLETLNSGNAAAISDYKAQVEKLQGLVDTARGQLEAAATEHDDLQHRLNVVAAEWAEQVETSRRLQIELDAAQQVPADSPELRQLRADLAEVAHDRDMYKHAHELLLEDANAGHARTKAMTVEAIAEWLEPVRAAIAAADNVAESTRAGWFAEEVIQHLPSIMRSLTGLDSPEDVD